MLALGLQYIEACVCEGCGGWKGSECEGVHAGINVAVDVECHQRVAVGCVQGHTLCTYVRTYMYSVPLTTASEPSADT